MTNTSLIDPLVADPERFWAKVEVGESGNCWPWTAGKQSRGYGVHYLPGRRGILAHRASLILTEGPGSSAAIEALHSCDNPACCNPNHLRWGTHAENMADMRERGRARAGRRMPQVCSRGHDLTTPNAVLTKTRLEAGRRYVVNSCRECNRIYLASRRNQRKGSK